MSQADRMRELLSAPILPDGMDFPAFLEEHIQADQGQYNFRGHEALREIAEMVPRSRFSVVTKGEQIGMSTLAISLACYLALKSGRRAGYFLPTNGFAQDFGATRLNPMIEKNELLAANIGETDNRQIKSMAGGYIYLRGLDSKKGAISIPLDLNLYDEVDFLNEEAREWAEGRIAHSDLGLQFFFSRGAAPGAGIDALFAETDRRKWLARCPACNEDQVLEDTFPDCVQRGPDGWRFVCPKCGGQVDREAGRWVAERPDLSHDRIGWRLSQLAVGAISLDAIMARWDRAQVSASKMRNFKGSVQALPDAGDLQPITDSVITLMRTLGHYRMAAQSSGGNVIWGADCGNRVHIVWGEVLAGRIIRVFFYEVVDSDRVVAHIDKRIAEFGAVAGVIDARPLLTEARKIYYQHPLSVWLQEFSGDEADELIRIHEGKEYRVLRVGRDLSLDDTTAAMSSVPPAFVLPIDDGEPIHREMNDHLKNLRKEKVQTPNGIRYKYIDRAPNHFGMAINSLRLAAERAEEGGRRFIGVLPVGTSLLAKPQSSQRKIA